MYRSLSSIRLAFYSKKKQSKPITNRKINSILKIKLYLSPKIIQLVSEECFGVVEFAALLFYIL